MEPFIRSINAILGSIRAEYRQIYNRYFAGYKRFDGDARSISEQVMDRLWEGDFYRTSLGHFDFFWMRDFGTVCQSIIKLGHPGRVHHTLSWVLFHYQRAGDITTCIDKAGHTFNAPAKKSIDALPWLLHCLVVSDYKLNKMERKFLELQLQKYWQTFLDPTTGNLKSMHFAEMRDAVFYDRSAYAVSLIARMAKCVQELELNGFPFTPLHYQEVLLKDYWNGEFFKADYVTNIYSSESALMPFFLGVINDEEMAGKTFDYINEAGLNKLYPLEYCQQPYKFKHRFGMGKWLMNNYTGTTIWTWHGTFYLHALKKFKRPEYKQQYKNFSSLIERHGTYPEMVNPDGSWYRTPIYNGDPGMVWAALFLEL